MRGDRVIKILEAVEDGMVNAMDLMAAFTNAGYGASVKRFEYEFRKIKRERAPQEAQKEHERRIRDQYYTLLYKLKKDHLLEEARDRRKKKIFSLTALGIKKLAHLRKKKEHEPPPRSKYEGGTSDRVTIIIFDVPEKERPKRDWLRYTLTSLGFTPLQKSVWVGKRLVPKRFIDDLKFFRIMDFVEIFEITKSGSLQQRI